MKGVLLLDTDRNFANIARRINGLDDDGQRIQHFMSDSPWDARDVFMQIQRDIRSRPELSGGMLTLDESGDVRSGKKSAGASRQHIGRLGTIAMGQVGVALGYYRAGIWAMVDAELFLPEVWFDGEHRKMWKRLHIPPERTFATKPQIGLEMILRAKANGLPFSVVSADELYGRSDSFRRRLDEEGITYIVDIPNDSVVYLEKPVVSAPRKISSHRKPRSLSNECPVKVRALVEHPDMVMKEVNIRHTERGLLTCRCAARRLWTVTGGGEVRPEWLLIRRESDGAYSYSLSNAANDVSSEQLTGWRSERYFAERVFQDVKSEAGWDELEAQKYRSWMHHTAIDALALWYIAGLKLDWERDHPRDETLAYEFELEVLPMLSMSNVRELLKAAMPLRQLTHEESGRLVAKHLVNRSRSTACRRRKQRQNGKHET